MYAGEVFFAALAVVPVCFLVHAFGRVYRHYRDGRQSFVRRKPKLYYAKRVNTLALACLALFSSLNSCPPTGSTIKTTCRMVCFALYCLAWLLSFCLLHFEYTRSLRASCLGQRLYWPASFAASIAYSVSQALGLETEKDPWPQVAAHILCGFMSLFLTFCAICRPDDFATGTWSEEKAVSSLLSPQISEEPRSPDQLPVVSIVMDNFKRKLQAERSVIWYEVIVSVDGVSSQLWKTYQDFEGLYAAIISAFRVEFPVLSIPKLPIFTLKDSVEIRLETLKRFIQDLNFPAFHCEDLLNFLNISGKQRDSLLKEHYKVTGRPDYSPALAMSNTESVTMQEAALFVRKQGSSSVFSFFEVSILDWRQCQDGHVDYDIQWRLAPDLVPALPVREGKVVHRFNEFYLLHKALKQDIGPAKLPIFPSKTYISRLTGVDKEAVDCRRRGLEHYLRSVLNDPAYLSPRLLDFLDCKRTIYRDLLLSHRPVISDIKLITPLQWECELGDSGEQHIVYLLEFERGTRHWTTKRHYKDFEQLHSHLAGRSTSPFLRDYAVLKGETDAKYSDLPAFPIKRVSSTSVKEMEGRKKDMEIYLQVLLKWPLIMEAFPFRQFLDEQ